MKIYHKRHQSGQSSKGLTLIEILTVVAIIAILAAILLPVLARQKINAKAKLAKLDCATIAQAVTQYNMDNIGRFPTKPGEEMNTVGSDITFSVHDDSSRGRAPHNSDIMIILSALEGLGDNSDVNIGHGRNIKKFNYLGAKMTDTEGNPGMGPNGMYRDPFGNPYVVTIDRNGDDKCWDWLYGDKNVSGTGPDHDKDGPGPDNNPEIGAHGLMRVGDDDANYGYVLMGKAMVWSAGPDQGIANGESALKGCNNANADNIIGW
jgi:prepilin-type N-terminal cleavage/methylation domain-containing protein